MRPLSKHLTTAFTPMHVLGVWRVVEHMWCVVRGAWWYVVVVYDGMWWYRRHVVERGRHNQQQIGTHTYGSPKHWSAFSWPCGHLSCDSCSAAPLDSTTSCCCSVAAHFKLCLEIIRLETNTDQLTGPTIQYGTRHQPCSLVRHSRIIM